MREPHSKPKVMPLYGVGWDIHGWFVVHYCCPPAPGENPLDDYCAWEYFDEQVEAMDDAFTHVREVHAPKRAALDDPQEQP